MDTTSGVVNDYLTFMYSFGFLSLINEPTRVQGALATCIDHCFIKCDNETCNDLYTYILNRDFTDHLPLVLSMSTVGKQAKNTTNNKIKEIKKVNQNLISQKLFEV